MKKIEAIIRKAKFDEVKEALNKAGIEFFTFWDVRGIGNAHEGRIYRGVSYDTSTIERILISIYCREKFVKPTIDAIMLAAKTGEIGDGKIFITDIEDCYRIRTGEQGDKSLYNPGGE